MRIIFCSGTHRAFSTLAQKSQKPFSVLTTKASTASTKIVFIILFLQNIPKLFCVLLLFLTTNQLLCLFEKVRTHFAENPNKEASLPRSLARHPAKKFSSFPDLRAGFFSSKWKRKTFCWVLLSTSRAADWPLFFARTRRNFHTPLPPCSYGNGRDFRRLIYTFKFKRNIFFNPQ